MEAGNEEPREGNDLQGRKAIEGAPSVAENATRSGPRFSQPSRPVTLLVLLARAARAGIIPSYLFLPAHDLLYGLRVPGSGHSRLFEFAAFAAHKGFLELVG